MTWMNKHGLGVLAVIVAIALAAVRAYQIWPPTPYLPLEDPDAGPVGVAQSPCFLAKVNKTGQECPEPKIIAGDAGSHLVRARYFIEMTENEKALADVDAALAIKPDDAAARHLAGRLAQSLFDVERADRELVEAHRLAPRDHRVATSYAMVLMGRRANVEALRLLSAVIAKRPEYLFARWQRAQLLIHLGECCGTGNFVPALADYDFMISKTAPNVSLLGGRAHVLVGLGRAEEAAADLTAALQLTPDSSELIKLRGRAYAASRKYELAVKDFDSLLEMQGGSPIHPMFENDRAALLMDRATALVELHRLADAARDAVNAVTLGGKAAVLRVQVMLRRHGFPSVPLDGQVSDGLVQALSNCFGLKACYHELRAI